MIDRIEVHPGEYNDSLRLLTATQAAQDVGGVEAALVAMATELNLGLLADLDFEPGWSEVPGAEDLVVAIRAADDEIIAQAQAAAAAALTALGARPSAAPGTVAPNTVSSAVRRRPARIALVSVPGEHAFVEAVDAIEAGLHVMIFSDNVTVDQEVALKALAADRGVLVMGPDCGTAIIGGVGLGFANVVAPGPVSLVGASGTGIQQICCLLDDAGVGVRHALGTGGRDLTDAVGGATTLRALDHLDRDPATEVIVVVSKPPEPEAAARLEAAMSACATPIVPALVGEGRTLTEAAAAVVDHLDAGPWMPTSWAGPSAGGRLLGLFSGGTLRDEAEVVTGVDDLLDLGADEYTRGRAHPMIDPTLRLEHLRKAVADDAVDTVLVDVVLGRGAHPDPMGGLAAELHRLTERGGAAVVSLCGTAADPQGRDGQAAQATGAGASVFLSNAAAGRHAAGRPPV